MYTSTNMVLKEKGNGFTDFLCALLNVSGGGILFIVYIKHSVKAFFFLNRNKKK